MIVFNSEMVEDSKLIVYPNPAINTLNIQFNENKAEKYSIVISDVAEKIVYTNKAISTTGYNNIKVNISRLANGVYTIVLVNGNLMQVKQFMKQ